MCESNQHLLRYFALLKYSAFVCMSVGWWTIGWDRLVSQWRLTLCGWEWKCVSLWYPWCLHKDIQHGTSKYHSSYQEWCIEKNLATCNSVGFFRMPKSQKWLTARYSAVQPELVSLFSLVVTISFQSTTLMKSEAEDLLIHQVRFNILYCGWFISNLFLRCSENSSIAN